MKRILILSFVVLSVAFVAACSGSKKAAGINAKPKNLAEAVAKADKKCNVDADCAAVKKGCCMCQGYESVNAKAAKKIEKIWMNECAASACTMQMCYVEIIPSCLNNTCVSSPKPMQDYFAN